MEATNRRKYVVFQFDSSPRPIRSHARVIPPPMTHCPSPNAASHGNPSWPGGLVQACCGTTKAGRILRRFPSNPFFAAAELFASLIKVATKPLRPTLRSATQFLIPDKRMGAGCQLASRTSGAHDWNDRSLGRVGTFSCCGDGFAGRESRRLADRGELACD